MCEDGQPVAVKLLNQLRCVPPVGRNFSDVVSLAKFVDVVANLVVVNTTAGRGLYPAVANPNRVGDPIPLLPLPGVFLGNPKPAKHVISAAFAWKDHCKGGKVGRGGHVESAPTGAAVEVCRAGGCLRFVPLFERQPSNIAL